MIGAILRAMAIAIAVMAAIDPAVNGAARGRPRIALIVEEPDLDRAKAAHARLLDQLRADFDLVSGHDAGADAAVVIGRNYPDRRPPERQRTFTVTVAPDNRAPGMRISALRAPREVTAGTRIHLEVDVDANNSAGATTTAIVRTGGAGVEVARASHQWTKASERWRQTFDVTPLDVPPWHLHAELSNVAGDRFRVDDTADAMVAAAGPMRVLVYEPRLSWAGTFVRRALERDARFDVAAVAYPSRGLSVTASSLASSLRAAITDETRAIVVGGLDRVTAEDARVLAAFMRDRGGSVVVLPDSRADAERLATWLPIPAVIEVLLEQPARLTTDAPLPSPDASELLTLGAAPGMRTLARTAAGAPVVAVAPVGSGQLLVSGLLDAWRFRANEHGAFDRFWQSAIAGLAAAVPSAIDVDVEPPIVAPSERVGVRVRVRRAAIGLGVADELRVSAALGNGDAVRLWPGDAPDTFQGSFAASSAAGAGRLTVTASTRGTGIAGYIVAPNARTARPIGPALSLLAESRGGIDVAPDDIPRLTRKLREEASAPAVRVERRPMRSLWWLAPFTACLGGEWWLRRRRGLR